MAWDPATLNPLPHRWLRDGDPPPPDAWQLQRGPWAGHGCAPRDRWCWSAWAERGHLSPRTSESGWELTLTACHPLATSLSQIGQVLQAASPPRSASPRPGGPDLRKLAVWLS